MDLVLRVASVRGDADNAGSAQSQGIGVRTTVTSVPKSLRRRYVGVRHLKLHIRIVLPKKHTR